MTDPIVFAFTQNIRFKKNSGMCCDYCHLKGHLKENWYKLVGYPPSHKFNRKKGFDRSQGSETSSMPTHSVLPMFTANQYQQLLKLINQESTITEARANMEGIKELLDTCLLAGSEPNSWVIDTRASKHMVSSLNLLTESTPVKSNSNKVYLPNGHTTSVTHT